MDYNKAFLPMSRSFSAVLLLHNGRCYEAEICSNLFLLRCSLIWYPFWPKSNFSDFRRFYQNRGDFLGPFYSTVEGAMKLKFAPSVPLEMLFHIVFFLAIYSRRKKNPFPYRIRSTVVVRRQHAKSTEACVLKVRCDVAYLRSVLHSVSRNSL